MASSFMDALVADLKRDEGLRLRPYLDSVGKITIGIGRNLDDVGISESEAEYLLANDIAAAELLLDRSLPWWRTLDEDRQRAMANLAFNLGPKLLEFHVTLRHLQVGNYIEAAEALLESKYAKQVGQRAVRVAALIRGGEAQT